jgi:hypothetical protein
MWEVWREYQIIQISITFPWFPMVSDADMKRMIERWKKGTHALRKPEEYRGDSLVKILEGYDKSMLKLFDDYLEFGAFFLLVGLLREMDIQRMESAPPQSSSMVSPCRTGHHY